MISAAYAINTKASETFVDVMPAINLFRFGEMKLDETYLFEIIANCNDFKRLTEIGPAGQKTRFVFGVTGCNTQNKVIVLRAETETETNMVNAYIELGQQAYKEGALPSVLHYNNNLGKAHILDPE